MADFVAEVPQNLGDQEVGHEEIVMNAIHDENVLSSAITLVLGPQTQVVFSIVFKVFSLCFKL